METRQDQPASGQLDWTDDIVVKTTKVLTTTGGTVWDAARRAAKYLQAMQQQIGLQEPGVKVLELGAGCGFLGLLLARNLPHAGEVCLTEQTYGGALEHLQQNVDANRHLPNMGSVTTCSCDWTYFLNEQLLQQVRGNSLSVSLEKDPSSQQQEQQQQQQQSIQSPSSHTAQQAAVRDTQGPAAAVPSSSTSSSAAAVGLQLSPSSTELADMSKLLSTHWDIIIGSDLIYNTAGVKGLPRVLAALMAPHSPLHVTAADSKQDSSQCSCNSNSRADAMHRKACNSVTRSNGGVASIDGSRQVCCFCTSSPQAAAQSAAIADSVQPGPVFYYAHTKHRFDAFDVDLMSELEYVGLHVQEVIEDGEELPPPSPPPFSSLYPEMRCAMFKITRKHL